MGIELASDSIVARLKMKDLVSSKFDFENSGVLDDLPPPIAEENAFFPN